MTNIKEMFEAQGEPIEAKDIRKGDHLARLWDEDTEYVVSIAKSDRAGLSDPALSHRLLHRPAPVLPTTPGSILANIERTARAVLIPGRGWYSFLAEEYRTAEDMQKRLNNCAYIILLDTGATK